MRYLKKPRRIFEMEFEKPAPDFGSDFVKTRARVLIKRDGNLNRKFEKPGERCGSHPLPGSEFFVSEGEQKKSGETETGIYKNRAGNLEPVLSFPRRKL